MNKLKLYYVLFLETVFLFTIEIFGYVSTNISSNVLSVPFTAIRDVIGKLTAMGNVGNGIAFAVIVLLGAIPFLAGILFKKVREDKVKMLSLIVLSVVSIFCFFVLIRYDLFCEKSEIGIKQIEDLFPLKISIAVLSTYAAAATVFIIRDIGMNNISKTLAYGNIMIYILCIAVTFNTFGHIFSALRMLFDTLDIYAETKFTLDTILKIVNEIPGIFCVLMLVDLDDVVCAFKNKEGNAAYLAGKAYSKAKIYILVSVFTETLLNILYTVMHKEILTQNYTFNFDSKVISVCIMLSILMAFKIIEKNEKLKKENELFI